MRTQCAARYVRTCFIYERVSVDKALDADLPSYSSRRTSSGTKPEYAEAGNPSRTSGEDGCTNQRYGRCVPIDMKAHFKLAQQHPRKQIGKHNADRTGQQSKHAELDTESAHDPHTGRAKSFEHDGLAHAAKARAGNAGGQDHQTCKN